MRYNSYYTENELQDMGFRSLGERVMISRDARIFSPETISIGDNVLIDAFTMMNGIITLGNHIHISSHCEIYGGREPIILGDFSAISSHSTLYGQTDDYVGPYLHNPTVPSRCRNLIEQPIIFEKYVLVATHCVVLPGVRLGEGCTFGACSLINKSTPPGGVYVGAPCRRIHERDLEGLHQREAELVEKERRRKERRSSREITRKESGGVI